MSTKVRLFSIRNQEEARRTLEWIGAFPEGVDIMAPKALMIPLHLEGLDARGANILKQEMLAAGGECAITADALNLTPGTGNALLLGTLQQYRRVCHKLTRQPFGLGPLATQIEEVIDGSQSQTGRELKMAHGKCLELGKRTLIMGILNLTPDSFSDGGLHQDHGSAMKHVERMIEEGADIIDVGGESTRPGAIELSEEEELERVSTILGDLVNKFDIPVSIDTRKPVVARAALDAGAAMVNDIEGLARTDMLELVGLWKCGVCIMHMSGDPRTMQENPSYPTVIGDIWHFLKGRIGTALENGLEPSNIIIDPGIGFGKDLSHNLTILNRLSELRGLGYPIMVGASRKRFIGEVTGEKKATITDENRTQVAEENDPTITDENRTLVAEEKGAIVTGGNKAIDRLEGSIASAVVAAMNGAAIVRAHDVGATRRALDVADAIKASKGL